MICRSWLVAFVNLFWNSILTVMTLIAACVTTYGYNKWCELLSVRYRYVLTSHHDHVINEFHETCHSVTFYFMKKDSESKQCCDTTTPESIHTKDESKRGSAFAFIFGVN